MANDRPLTTITTSSRCPACGIEEIAPRAGARAGESVQVWSCLRCAFAFYRYQRADDDGASDGGRRLPAPMGGVAPSA